MQNIYVGFVMSKVCQLFSGSSGNSIYIASRDAKILVDAGVSCKRLSQGLMDIGEDPSEISAIFITHEHSDHIKGVKVFAKKYNIPVFAEENVLEAMYSAGHITRGIPAEKISGNMELCGVEIVPFQNSHDSVACVGYRFNLMDGRSVSVCTDTGYVTNDAKSKITGSDLVFLESNHEITMLQNGPYPYPLKQRILSDYGHLSNEACSEFASYLVENGTTRLILSHLSKENNYPNLALQTTLSKLNDSGFSENVDFRLRVSPEENFERPIVL